MKWKKNQYEDDVNINELKKYALKSLNCRCGRRIDSQKA